jgi:hypothetical protein
MTRTHEAARATSSSSTSTVALGAETRTIYYAEGLDFRATDSMSRRDRAGVVHDRPLLGPFRLMTDARTPQFLAEARNLLPAATRWDALSLTSVGADEWRYESAAQGVTYVIRRISTRDAFKRALEERGAIVVYNGHARYGRGPCFGPPGSAHGENWEDGTDVGTGIFRMGYPHISAELKEVEDHGYTPSLAGPAPGAPPAGAPFEADDCDPDLRPHLARLRVANLHTLSPVLTRVADRPVYTYRAFAEGEQRDHVVHRAGFRGTAAAAQGMELGATTMACRVFFHMGCSTFRHNYRVVRHKYGFTREGDDHHCYWTTDVSIGPHTSFIVLYRMLAYDQPSANQPFGPWLDYVVRQTNADLRACGLRYRII